MGKFCFFRYPIIGCLLFSTVFAEPKTEGKAGPKLIFQLSSAKPGTSYGTSLVGGKIKFPVGFGKKGLTPAGQVFKGGYTLLGEFRVTAILSQSRFEMDPALIKSSGKSEAWLRQNLFSNMSSIDFDGDGKGREYGDSFIGLAPVNSKVKQPFHFGAYKGVYRWYSFAIHGTQDPSRIGKGITGGCINVGKESLVEITRRLKVGDHVLVKSID